MSRKWNGGVIAVCPTDFLTAGWFGQTHAGPEIKTEIKTPYYFDLS
jgi:hypothetical protein